jgi:hypothetical protein
VVPFQVKSKAAVKRCLILPVLIAVASASLFGALVTACSVGSAHDTPEANDERSALARFLYSSTTARLEHWDNWASVPSTYQAISVRLRNLPVELDGVRVGLFRVTYTATNLPQFSVHIKRAGNSKLLVYNHGHGGLPLNEETFAIEFLKSALVAGFDLLIASMPMTGLNAVSADDKTPYFMTARGRPEPAHIPHSMLRDFKFQHALFEAIDENDHYLHYFVDGAIIPVSTLSAQVDRNSPVRYLAEAAQSGPIYYHDISYVGLSGGAAVGLTACALHRFDRCILIAGVMPEYLRLVENGWGDAEQVTRSYYGQFGVPRLLSMAMRNSGKLVLLYNRFDTCCFSDPQASQFQRDFPTFDIRITELTYHGYVASTLLDLLR